MNKYFNILNIFINIYYGCIKEGYILQYFFQYINTYFLFHLKSIVLWIPDNTFCLQSPHPLTNLQIHPGSHCRHWYKLPLISGITVEIRGKNGMQRTWLIIKKQCFLCTTEQEDIWSYSLWKHPQIMRKLTWHKL